MKKFYFILLLLVLSLTSYAQVDFSSQRRALQEEFESQVDMLRDSINNMKKPQLDSIRALFPTPTNPVKQGYENAQNGGKNVLVGTWLNKYGQSGYLSELSFKADGTMTMIEYRDLADHYDVKAVYKGTYVKNGHNLTLSLKTTDMQIVPIEEYKSTYNKMYKEEMGNMRYRIQLDNAWKPKVYKKYMIYVYEDEMTFADPSPYGGPTQYTEEYLSSKGYAKYQEIEKSKKKIRGGRESA